MAYTKKKWAKPTITPKEFKIGFPPSHDQMEMGKAALLGMLERCHHNTMAVAGSGKTTASHFIVFDYLVKNDLKRKLGHRSILYTSFATAIVKEVAPYYEGKKELIAAGLHSLGYRSIRERFGSVKVNKYKVGDLLVKKWPTLFNYRDVADLEEKSKRSDNFFIMQKLIHFTKVTLTDPSDVDALLEMAYHFNVDQDADLNLLVNMIQDVMQANDELTSEVDFDDQLYFVYRFDLKLPVFDLVIGDEDQDYNAAMHHMIAKLSGSFMGIGDERQAIYGFAGADCESVRNLVKKLDCKELVLGVNYRCGKEIIKLAQSENPIIQPWDQSPDGVVQEMKHKDVIKSLVPGMMGISRVNKNLVGPAFQLYIEGVPVTIKDRDLSGQILKIHDPIAKKSKTLVDADSALQDYYDREKERLEKRKNTTVSSLELLENKVDALRMFYDRCSANGDNLDSVPKYINAIISEHAKSGAVNFTTGHGAKGLEADRVFILDWPKIKLCHPKQKPWEIKQESNLKYIAITRAKKELTLVDSPEK